MTDESVKAGVIGVGSMGTNHVRVYDELPGASLVGVHDADTDRAAEVAASYNTTAHGFDDLIEMIDVASIAVPTEHHFETVRACIEDGVDILVEKPFVANPDRGRQLIAFANDNNIILQVGHIERFNPAVMELVRLLPDLDIIAVDAQRLGPPIDREIDDDVIIDLMIHDIDLMRRILGDPVDIAAMGTDDGNYATAMIRTETGAIGTMTSSRQTQDKVRQLTITATDRRILLDFIDQSIEVSRRSLPAFVRREGSVHYRHETVIEELFIERREPLKNQLDSFLEAVATRSNPLVTGEDGLRAVELAHRIQDAAGPRERPEPEAPSLR